MIVGFHILKLIKKLKLMCWGCGLVVNCKPEVNETLALISSTKEEVGEKEDVGKKEEERKGRNGRDGEEAKREENGIHPVVSS